MGIFVLYEWIEKNCEVVILVNKWTWINSPLPNMQNCWLPPPAAAADASIDERDGFRNGVEIIKSFSDKHIDLLRPAARFYAASKGTLFLFRLEFMFQKFFTQTHAHIF